MEGKGRGIIAGTILAFVAGFLFLPVAARATNYTVVRYDVGTDHIATQTLTKDRSPYLIEGGCYSDWVEAGETLTIDPGVVVKFAPIQNCQMGKAAAHINVAGKLIVNGTADEPVIFTSWFDDAAGGDMNGDGDATAPAAGDWGGVVASGASANIEIHHAIFRYGGGGSFNCSVQVGNGVAGAAFDHVEVATSSAVGLCADVPLDLEGSSFHGNHVAGVVAESQFYFPHLDAQNSWWGDSSGPAVGGNSDGTGDAIQGDVAFVPWLKNDPASQTATGTLTYISTYPHGIATDTIFLPTQPVFKIALKGDSAVTPDYLRVVVSGTPYDLSKLSGGTKTRRYYGWQPADGTFLAGRYSYHFELSINGITKRLPASGELSFSIENTPVIVIPGILGSEPKDGVWVIDPILHTYDNLLATLEANGFSSGQDLFTFPYDWHQSNVLTARQLADKIALVKALTQADKVDLVAHSMGALAAQEYIESDYYQHDVDQLITLGAPEYGAPSAYLLWEGGEFGPGIENSLEKFIYSREAQKLGYNDLFDYIHDAPVSSVKELLPTNNYLVNQDTEEMRTYPTGYPRNTFLENLQNASSSLLSSGVRLTAIVGNTGVSSTVIAIRLDSTTTGKLWSDGYPDGYANIFGDHGLVEGAGDGVVPFSNTETFSSSTVVLPAEHGDLPSAAEGLIVRRLLGLAEPVTIHKTNLLNLGLLIVKILSPADILVVAPNGRQVGKDFATGEAVNEIPGAFYSGFQTDNQFVTIPNPTSGTYEVKLKGKDNGGDYTLSVGTASSAGLTDKDYQASITPQGENNFSVNVGDATTSTSSSLEVVPDDQTSTASGTNDTTTTTENGAKNNDQDNEGDTSQFSNYQNGIFEWVGEEEESSTRSIVTVSSTQNYSYEHKLFQHLRFASSPSTTVASAALLQELSAGFSRSWENEKFFWPIEE